jgi:hypothetical protein
MVGFVEEYRGTGALAVSVERAATARQADANDLIRSRSSQPYVDDEGRYVRADEAIAFYKDLNGIRLVVEQRIPGV